MKILLYILAFLVSLHSYYFYEFNLALISVLAASFLVLLLLLGRVNSISYFSSNSVFLAGLYVLFFVWGALGVLFLELPADLKRSFGFIMIIFLLLGTHNLFKIIDLRTFTKLFLITHAFFFYIQFFSFYVFGVAVDFLEPFTGESQRTHGSSLEVPIFGKVMRPSGLHNEPGTYCTFIAPFCAIISRWYAMGKSDRFAYWLSLSSLVFSFSLFGIFFAILIFLFSPRLSKTLRLAFLSCVSAFSLPMFYYRFFIRAEYGLDGGQEARWDLLKNSIESFDQNPINILFGTHNVISPFSSNVEYSISTNDIGLVFSLFLHFGVFLWPLIVCAIIYSLRSLDLSSRIALLILLLSKQSLFCPFLPIALYSIYSMKAYDSRKITNMVSYK